MIKENKCNEWSTDQEVHPYTVTTIIETAILTANSNFDRRNETPECDILNALSYNNSIPWKNDTPETDTPRALSIN